MIRTDRRQSGEADTATREPRGIASKSAGTDDAIR
jgi:hypothetical protein